MECVFRDLSVAHARTLAALHVQAFQETHAPRDGGPALAPRLWQWADLLGASDGQRFVVGCDAHDGRSLAIAAGCPHDGDVPGYRG